MCISMEFVEAVTKQMSSLASNIPILYNTAPESKTSSQAMFRCVEDQQLELVLCYRVLEQHFKGVLCADGSIDKDALVHSLD